MSGPYTQSVPFRRTQIRKVFGQGAVEGTPGQIRLSFGHLSLVVDVRARGHGPGFSCRNVFTSRSRT